MLKVAIDLDCLLENQCMSHMVVGNLRSDVELYITTDSMENLDQRLGNLMRFFPKFIRNNMFLLKEKADIVVNEVETPGDWFKHHSNISKLCKEMLS